MLARKHPGSVGTRNAWRNDVAPMMAREAELSKAIEVHEAREGKGGIVPAVRRLFSSSGGEAGQLRETLAELQGRRRAAADALLDDLCDYVARYRPELRRDYRQALDVVDARRNVLFNAERVQDHVRQAKRIAGGLGACFSRAVEASCLFPPDAHALENAWLYAEELKREHAALSRRRILMPLDGTGGAYDAFLHSGYVGEICRPGADHRVLQEETQHALDLLADLDAALEPVLIDLREDVRAARSVRNAIRMERVEECLDCIGGDFAATLGLYCAADEPATGRAYPDMIPV